MIPVYDLDPVIRTVERPEEVEASSQVLVTIDCKTGKPVGKSAFSFLGRGNRRYYVVTNTNSEEAVAVHRNLAVRIMNFEGDWSFDLRLDYEARCSPGREAQVAEALWDGANPQERLDSFLRVWVRHLLDGCEADFVSDFDRKAEALRQGLRARALQETGLILSPRVKLEFTDRLDPLVLGPLHLPVRVKDWHERLDLSLEAELAVEPGKERIAYLHRDRHEDLRKELRKCILEYLATNVSLQQFYAQLGTKVREDLEERLNALAAGNGRKVTRLILEGELFFDIVNTKKIEHTFSHRLTEYPDPVTVNTELLLQLSDVGKYARSQMPDLGPWAAQKVKEIATACLFGVTYTELCLHHEEKKAEIEQRMKKEAAEIGYELKQLITITDLQFDILRRPFPIELEGEFPTQLAKLKVRLAVSVVVRIPDPNKIADLLDRRIDVRAHIQKGISDRIMQKLHQIDPESFYMEFEVAKEQGSRSVREQLETVIRETLKEEFHADLLSVSCKQLETEISERLDLLLSRPVTFEVTVVPSRGGPEIFYDGSFRLNGVDENGWRLFQKSLPDFKDLRECTERHLRQILADKTVDALRKETNEEQRKMVHGWVQERLQREFGLLVEVMDWVRRPSEVEQEAAAAHQQYLKGIIHEQIYLVEAARKQRELEIGMRLDTAQDRRDKLGKLQKELTRVMLAGGDPEQERDLQEKIRTLQKDQVEACDTAVRNELSMITTNLRAAVAALTAGEPDTGPEPGSRAQDAAGSPAGS